MCWVWFGFWVAGGKCTGRRRGKDKHLTPVSIFEQLCFVLAWKAEIVADAADTPVPPAADTAAEPPVDDTIAAEPPVADAIAAEAPIDDAIAAEPSTKSLAHCR